jgi:L-threonylcarbamoyladenylate synthase
MTQVERAALIIRKGGIVAFPTETVYGLGADAFSPVSVARIFEVKRRPFFDPLIVHIAEAEDLFRLASEVPSDAAKLSERFWPGPLTLVLPKRQEVPDIVTAGLSTVAVRVPDHPMALRLIELSERPIAAPSANLFGCLSPTRAEHVRDQLGETPDMILDGGPCRVGVESTIVAFYQDGVRVLRPGGVPLEDIEAVLDRPVHPMHDLPQTVAAPGMLPKHYSPRTRVVLGRQQNQDETFSKERIGVLAFQNSNSLHGVGHVEVLSETGDLREAAANLFSALKRLDRLGLDLILAEPIPEIGLGRAIMDRLRRASAQNGEVLDGR